MGKITTKEEAVSIIKSEDNVFIHSVAAAPQVLIGAMVERHNELQNVNIYHIHTEGPAPYTKPEYSDSFNTKSMFIGNNIRRDIAEGRADYIPIFLSETPNLFKKGIVELDVCLIQVSPPDKHGFCTLGTSVDVTRTAALHAKIVIAQINNNMPKTHGDGFIHVDDIDYLVEHNSPLPTVESKPLSDEEIKIGKYISELIEDGATLQMGIGSIPDAVLSQLGNHKKLGIHTEMFAERVIDLVEKGIITGEEKAKHPGKIVSTFVMGSQKLYNFIDDNPEVAMLDVNYVNNSSVIRKNPKVTAINSAIEVDLTGQVCADSIGSKLYSGVGGQMDFIRGASLSEGGKPIIALTSQTKKGLSKIVPTLKEGAGVVTTRAHVHYIVTEYGVANLYGKSIRQRVKELIKISHPDHREELEKQAHELYKY